MLLTLSFSSAEEKFRNHNGTYDVSELFLTSTYIDLLEDVVDCCRYPFKDKRNQTMWHLSVSSYFVWLGIATRHNIRHLNIFLTPKGFWVFQNNNFHIKRESSMIWFWPIFFVIISMRWLESYMKFGETLWPSRIVRNPQKCSRFFKNSQGSNTESSGRKRKSYKIPT